MPKLTLVELKQTSEYASLTEKQRKFIDQYAENGHDQVAATSSAYNCKNEEISRIYSYRVMAMPGIILTLARYFDNDPLEDFLTTLRRMILTGRLSETQYKGMRLYATVAGWPFVTMQGPVVLPPPEAKETKEPVSDAELPRPKSLLDEF